MTWEIRCGNALQLLKAMPDEHVQTVVTSPPYWGLRAYETEPQVWGGVVDHAHQWSAAGVHRGGPPRPSHSGSILGERGTQAGSVAYATRGSSAGEFCACGAWRGELGLEPTPSLYVAHIVELFREVHRVLRKDGTLWLNLGDTYVSSSLSDHHRGKATPAFNGRGDRQERAKSAENPPRRPLPPGLKPKDMVGIPWRVAFALQDDGWWLRRDIIWNKPNPMPEAAQDRPTGAHEYLFLLSKRRRYHYDAQAIMEPVSGGAHPRGGADMPTGWDASDSDHHQLAGRYKKPCGPNSRMLKDRVPKPRKHQNREAGRGFSAAGENGTRNKRSVWTIATEAFPEAHFATFPQQLVEPCVLAGTSPQACEKCGAPWRRVVQDPDFSEKPRRKTSKDAHLRNGDRMVAGEAWQEWRKANPSTTVGWRASCRCDNVGSADCIVFDPFTGSGTVGVVALRHGRRFLGLELSPKYVAMARRRIGGPLFAEVGA